ncbi:MAG TPA: carbohydrate ABC transporter permease [Candidatus Eisenbergiella merdavium]|uniref:Carbohydrate ABC transporter permease n=1 Tax=Candidatus Eisenbergiella merdavium TaxID=2838551 RepID=A0A9D2SS85_9FIRM|nr:carbohydrate ABC transporter permease [Candidatus Eisenbergiella merdavium]
MDKKTIKRSWPDRIFNAANLILLGLIGLVAVLPYINMIAVSLSSSGAVDSGRVTFYPIGFHLENYKTVLMDKNVLKSIGISVAMTVVGTIFSLLLTVMLAFPLSREEFKLRKVCNVMILIVFIFSAPVIPWYLTMRSYGLYDNFWALILPSALSTYNIIIVRSFFQEIPSALIDAAKVDGCGEMRTLMQIILPISKAVMATVGLMYGVGYWNSYTNPLYLINDRNLYTLQLRIKSIVLDSEALESMNVVSTGTSTEALKMTTIIVAALPVLCVYPFLQKYFIKGMTIGSVKG